ncbi:Spy/CpxP family protein refolding chaperone [Mesorhizobium sp. ANAO-SY3R2]|uniref:Spy/CpxP family protein refolding chaperone n=1 Tax=Mesorhizobium sp. ANAO-SY3R2 TaxID=3166644 RepID=UPI00366B0859
MLRTAIIGLTALCISAPTLTYAQTAAPKAAKEAQESINWKALTEARIDVVKAALQLTPEQEKLWPPVEAAIKARAEARQARIATLKKMQEQEPDFFDLMRDRADNMTQRAAGLKQLADAWQPLYQSLDDKQKARLMVLAKVVMHEARGAVERHRMQYDDDGDGGDE